nr:immunoglobulin heavy chain junction region [Macaca mulatta]MOW24083.1 immunoglobulin heavy chain junction region [Macaca mulatta]MOW24155.1 immunoglobulin heavy chain junction region [Macaca mulatta]MOW24794.1 immunoglobulin heavy chain junction region [Macaca mulatta]MOW24890.1 immunoglobulin heavy chain junction region [Macaca mulatta]
CAKELNFWTGYYFDYW